MQVGFDLKCTPEKTHLSDIGLRISGEQKLHKKLGTRNCN